MVSSSAASKSVMVCMIIDLSTTRSRVQLDITYPVMASSAAPEYESRRAKTGFLSPPSPASGRGRGGAPAAYFHHGNASVWPAVGPVYGQRAERSLGHG